MRSRQTRKRTSSSSGGSGSNSRRSRGKRLAVCPSEVSVQVFGNRDLVEIVASFVQDARGLSVLRGTGRSCRDGVDRHVSGSLALGRIRGGFRLASTRHLLPADSEVWDDKRDMFAGGLCGQPLEGGDILLIGPSTLAPSQQRRMVGYLPAIFKLNSDTMGWNLISSYEDFDNGSDCRIRPVAWNVSQALAFASHTLFDARNEASSYYELSRCFTLDTASSSKQWIRHQCSDNQPLPRFRQTSACAVIGSKLYLFGGGQIRTRPGSIKEYGDDLWELDLETFVWEEVEKGSLWPPAMSSPICLVLGKKMVIFSGCGYKANQKDMVKHICVFDTKSRVWSQPKMSGMRPRLTNVSSAASIGDMVICAGNFGRSNSQGGCIYALNTNTWRWSKVEIEGETWCRREDGHLIVAKHPSERMKLFLLGGLKRATIGPTREDDFVRDIFELEVRLFVENS